MFGVAWWVRRGPGTQSGRVVGDALGRTGGGCAGGMPLDALVMGWVPA